MRNTRGKLLFTHQPEQGYTRMEVRVCMDDQDCRTVMVEDAELGDSQTIHLSKSARAAMIEALT